MNKLNNFELHEEAMNLSVINTGYKLAKMYLQEKQELEELKEKYENLNQMFEDYLAAHKVIQAELERLQMQKSIDYTRVQYELEC
ncbi:hypothetical protein [Aeromonas phage 4L372XY]|uniref:Uncharacterized protein n=1 Tax=Aeromonas phage 4L372XY TaxID=2588520 RepID=A0A5B9N441_9CAUD|nr:hypothetical protein HWC28_gp133 [Aeromonas phage 4L372XY]QEG08848.1 hypothetical protein [Aeromonas phage 4L372XY]